MARNPHEVLKFLLDNLDPLLEISRERRRFASTDDIARPFRRALEEGAHIGRRIADMKRLGILIPAAGEWTIPAYVRDFLQRLQEQHAATAPSVVKAIIGALEDTTSRLAESLENPGDAGSLSQAELALKAACELFYEAVDRLEQTCLAIETEVVKYRGDASMPFRAVKASLRHLLDLYGNYLVPLVDVIDLNGLFVVTSNRLLNCCERLFADPNCPPALAEQAQISHDAVMWQRQRTLHYTASIRHELEPLYQIALRDSKIAKGINRVHTIFASNPAALAGLLDLARIEESRDANFLCDDSIRNEFRRLRNYEPPLPPTIAPFAVSELTLPPQFAQLRDALLDEPCVPDLIEWLSERCGTANADHVLKCLSRLYNECGRSMTALDAMRCYEFENIFVNAHIWEWRALNGATA